MLEHITISTLASAISFNSDLAAHSLYSHPFLSTTSFPPLSLAPRPLFLSSLIRKQLLQGAQLQVECFSTMRIRVAMH